MSANDICNVAWRFVEMWLGRITDPVECYDIMWKAKEYLFDYALVKEGSAMEDTNPYGDHSPGHGFKMAAPVPPDIFEAVRLRMPITIVGVKYVPEEPVTRADALDNTHDGLINDANRIISGDREAVYGDAGEDFTRTGKMWAAILGLDAVRPEQVALCMTALKIGRLCETPNHRDGWVDGIGYLALGGQIALNPEGAA
jgi:hypothetical protein